MTPQRKVLFVALAMNQTRFFHAVGQAMAEKGYSVAHLCFHEPSFAHLREEHVQVYNAFDKKYEGGRDVSVESVGIRNANLMLSHEKQAFEVWDTARLLRKLSSYLKAANAVANDWMGESGAETVVVQELGGFLSNIATFHVAQSRGADNIFIEPSFFRGRIFFVRNSFAAPKLLPSTSAEARDVVRKQLEHIRANQQIVIPTKDTHHYRHPVRKLLDRRNWRRLIEKSAEKFVLGKREEFGHIGGHVKRHVRMFLNSLRFKRLYRPLPQGEPFVYYPLHVPADAALTIRSPACLDQYALLDYLARSVPLGHKVVIKEHPAMVGAVDSARIRDLLRRRDNVVMINPGTNNHEVVRRAAAVVTVNSKAGAEALLAGTPVVVLGDAFYTTAPYVSPVSQLTDLPETLRAVISERPTFKSDDLTEFFARVWSSSFPGELYDCSEKNVKEFAESLMQFLEPSSRPRKLRDSVVSSIQ